MYFLSTVNSGKALDNDGSSSQMPGLQCCVLPAAALAVVVISDHDPRQTIGLHTTGWLHSVRSICLISQFREVEEHGFIKAEDKFKVCIMLKKKKTTKRAAVKGKLNNPASDPHLIVTGDIRDASVLSCQVVFDLVDGIVLAVDGTDQHVVGDVVQVTAELQPRPGSADVVCGAFALHLQRRHKRASESCPAAVSTFR